MIKLINSNETRLFLEIMERMDKTYDEKAGMITQWRGENGYHSTLSSCTVHPTYNSLEYAFELMNRGQSGDFARAEQIVDKVIKLQDIEPLHDTYGIWPYYLEEPLEKMAPPDWNWADFCGKKLLQILLEYSSVIPGELKERMHQAILHACNSIMRRNMGPHYTNISIMGTYVTLAAGELFREPYLIEYAKKRLRELYAYNMERGAYQEYNSPSYTWVVITDLASCFKYIRDTECRFMVEGLNDLAWKCVAEHFHYRTKQWSGPHCRFYSMLEDDQLLMRIQRALDYRITLVPLDKTGLGEKLPMDFFSTRSHCPEKYIRYFTKPNETSFAYTMFAYDKINKNKQIAAAYITEEYSLGTFYKSTFWNQKRNHLSYFGTEKSPVYCGLKCLHDGYDYSSGQIVTAQNKNRAVSVIGFATDGGDTHPNLDLVKDAAITVSDLRLRFEIGGAADTVRVKRISDTAFEAVTEEVTIYIVIPYVKFGNYPVAFEINEQKDHVNETGNHKNIEDIKYIDAVLYHGPETKICFSDLNQCCLAVYFQITADRKEEKEPVIVNVENDKLIIEQGELRAEGIAKACTLEEFVQGSGAYVNGREYSDLINGQAEAMFMNV